jgi:hypothetical protein
MPKPITTTNKTPDRWSLCGAWCIKNEREQARIKDVLPFAFAFCHLKFKLLLIQCHLRFDFRALDNAPAGCWARPTGTGTREEAAFFPCPSVRPFRGPNILCGGCESSEPRVLFSWGNVRWIADSTKYPKPTFSRFFLFLSRFWAFLDEGRSKTRQKILKK